VLKFQYDLRRIDGGYAEIDVNIQHDNPGMNGTKKGVKT
jgi:hypothetical protein